MKTITHKQIMFALILLIVMIPGMTMAQKGKQNKKPPPQGNKPVHQHVAPPREAHRVPQLPKGSHEHNFNGRKFHYNRGVYYRWDGHNYRVTHAPIGFRISILPPGYSSFWFRDAWYYHYYGTYYVYDEIEKVYIVTENPAEQESVKQDVETEQMIINSEFDVVQMVDGSTIEGYYLGGSKEMILFQAAGDTLQIPVEDIISLNIAPEFEKTEE